jgi:hypothetical protein
VAVNPCVIAGNCQREIQEADSGRTFRYPVSFRFAVVLDRRSFPPSDFTVTCAGDPALGFVSNVPVERAPLYARAFEGVRAGTCTLHDGSFNVTIIIFELPY